MDSRDHVVQPGGSAQPPVPGESPSFSRKICIAAGIIKDERGFMLLVRKRGTEAFIQPGGKIEVGESGEEALRRELKEELNCVAVRMEFCGKCCARAVNEPGCLVEAVLFRVEIEGAVGPGAEIAEMVWVDPGDAGERELAPLTRDFVMEIARRAD